MFSMNYEVPRFDPVDEWRMDLNHAKYMEDERKKKLELEKKSADALEEKKKKHDEKVKSAKKKKEEADKCIADECKTREEVSEKKNPEENSLVHREMRNVGKQSRISLENHSNFKFFCSRNNFQKKSF